MQLIDDFCHSQYYNFEESYNTVITDNFYYLCHSISFKSYRNLHNKLESLICDSSEVIDEDINNMTKEEIEQQQKEDKELKIEAMLNRVNQGLPAEFGTKPKRGKSEKKVKKEKKTEGKLEKRKKEEAIEHIYSDMYLQVHLNNTWIPCVIVDIDLPVEYETYTDYCCLIRPLSIMSNWEDSVDVSPDDVAFLTPLQEANLLVNSTLSNHPSPIISLHIKDMKIIDSKSHLPHALRKYYNQRYHLFSRWDAGIQYDEEGLFSVTPEALALHTAIRCSCNVVIDAFAGIGGNTIQLARTCHHVIAIDMNASRLRLLQHNSSIYDVQNKIELICGDSLQLLPTLKADVVLLAPPWGGVDYNKKEIFRLEDLPPGLDGTHLFHLARQITKNVVFILPRNIDRKQVAELGDQGEVVEIVEGIIEGNVKMIIAYFGDLVSPSSDIKLLL